MITKYGFKFAWQGNIELNIEFSCFIMPPKKLFNEPCQCPHDGRPVVIPCYNVKKQKNKWNGRVQTEVIVYLPGVKRKDATAMLCDGLLTVSAITSEKPVYVEVYEPKRFSMQTRLFPPGTGHHIVDSSFKDHELRMVFE